MLAQNYRPWAIRARRVEHVCRTHVRSSSSQLQQQQQQIIQQMQQDNQRAMQDWQLRNVQNQLWLQQRGW